MISLEQGINSIKLKFLDFIPKYLDVIPLTFSLFLFILLYMLVILRDNFLVVGVLFTLRFGQIYKKISLDSYLECGNFCRIIPHP